MTQNISATLAPNPAALISLPEPVRENISRANTSQHPILATIQAIFQKIIDQLLVVGKIIKTTFEVIFSCHRVQVRQLSSDAEQQEAQSQIVALERKAVYPLGPSESFVIDHGRDYFAFFKRLGELHYFTATENGQLAGVGAGILRDIPLQRGQPPQKAWYLCDLKIDPEFRGHHIPMHIFARAAWHAFKCSRGYAISMNPATGENRMAKMFKRYSWLSVSEPKTLALFSCNQVEMRQLKPILERHRGPVSFLSLQGKKDLILQSTGRPMPLLHAQFGPCRAEQPTCDEPQEGYTHMFCTATADPLYTELTSQNVAPAATASIISRGMDSSDWSFILTSDI